MGAHGSAPEPWPRAQEWAPPSTGSPTVPLSHQLPPCPRSKPLCIFQPPLAPPALPSSAHASALGTPGALSAVDGRWRLSGPGPPKSEPEPLNPEQQVCGLTAPQPQSPETRSSLCFPAQLTVHRARDQEAAGKRIRSALGVGEPRSPGPGGREGTQQGDGTAELAVGSGAPGAVVPTILALFLAWYGSLFTSAALGAC